MRSPVSLSSASTVSRIESQQVRQLREIDTFGPGHLFVGAQNREGQHVQRGRLVRASRRPPRSPRPVSAGAAPARRPPPSLAALACCRIAARSCSFIEPSALAAGSPGESAGEPSSPRRGFAGHGERWMAGGRLESRMPRPRGRRAPRAAAPDAVCDLSVSNTPQARPAAVRMVAGFDQRPLRVPVR